MVGLAAAFGEAVHFAAQGEGFGNEPNRPLEFVPVEDVAERDFQCGENWLLNRVVVELARPLNDFGGVFEVLEACGRRRDYGLSGGCRAAVARGSPGCFASCDDRFESVAIMLVGVDAQRGVEDLLCLVPQPDRAEPGAPVP